VSTIENRIASSTVFAVLIAVTTCHLINDTLQALMLAIYPILRDSYALTFGQIGMIPWCFRLLRQSAALIGHFTDRCPALFIARCTALHLGLVAGSATSYQGFWLLRGVGIGHYSPRGPRGKVCLGGATVAKPFRSVAMSHSWSTRPARLSCPRAGARLLKYCPAAIGILRRRRWYSFTRPKNAAPSTPCHPSQSSTRTVSLSLAILLALSLNSSIRQLQQLLHVLSDRPFPGTRERRADLSLCLFRGFRHRHLCRRPHW
jgi:hypothetical protein